jgi:competence ComEA-like helix-hairpin-helix protein
MTKLPGMGTKWFFLSHRELLVLALGVGAVLALINAAGLVERLWGGGRVTVMQPGDNLPLPALIDVNSAPDYELALLPGIGPKTARAIVDYIYEHKQYFASLDELTRVRGVGPATVEAIRPYATCVLPDEDAIAGE